MMISPETFYEMECKDKPYEVLLAQARRLKRQINRCKRLIERMYTEDPEVFICPSLEAQCSCSYDYLDMVIKAIQENGCEYPMTKEELKSEAFNNNLEHIKKLTFDMGGFFYGHTTCCVEFGERVTFKKEPFIIEADIPVDEEAFKKNELIAFLKELRIGTWKHRYDNIGVLDGTQWEVSIEFSNGARKQSFYGSNAYPWDFERFKGLFK